MSFMNQQNPFKWRHFAAEIILLCVRWYLRYSLSYRDLEEMMEERGLTIDHTTIYRWVQRNAPDLEKRCRPHLKACNDSWRVDETYMNIKKPWMYLYRAVDSEGNTLEFLLSPTRDAEAAKRFFVTALRRLTCSVAQASAIEQQGDQPIGREKPKATRPFPRVINVDKHAAYPKAIADLKASGVLPESVELRQVKDLNNLVEKDHRLMKRMGTPGLAVFQLSPTRHSLWLYQAMNIMRKRQRQRVEKGDIRCQVTYIATLFGVAV